jgi:sulfite reductase beta subunit-like hemoprotein
MVRVRITGGDVSVAQLAGLADAVEKAGGYAHLTSRQDLQLHDVSAEQVVEAVRACDGLGLPFKGGGGNIYRNTVVGADSGLSSESVFDVYPYAHALNLEMLRFEKAYALPRKFKVAFFAGDRDVLRAATHDLGFVARLVDGRRGFRVYAGGGMGRESATGLCLVEFLPAEQAVHAAFALIALYHDHGDRSNRSQARLRFLVKRLGAEAFMRLFWEYFVTLEPAGLPALGRETSLPAGFGEAACRGADAGAGEGNAFEQWRAIAVSPTRFGDAVKSVRLFVPHGNLTGRQLHGIARLAEQAGSPFVRLLVSQDVLVPFVPDALLPGLFLRLREELGEIDLTFRSYKGHIVTCVGSSVCKIGMVGAPAVADKLAEKLDAYLPADTEQKRALQRLVADEVRISGCPNACSGHPVARVGIGCLCQNVGGSVQSFGRLLSGAGVAGGAPRLSSEPGSGKLYPVEELVDAAAKAVATLAGLEG